jgi:ubiquinone/menaquinone biosynthesis C-methylase UbiE
MQAGVDPEIIARFENDTWSRCAQSYAETFHSLTAQAVPLLVAAAVESGRQVLDLGSGPGDGSALLADTGAIVTGVDFSSRMVAVARRRHPHIEFHEGDAERLPFDDRTFDAVVSNCVVHHLARPAAVFGEVSRVLVPGGRFAFSVWGAAEEQTGFGVFFAAVQAHHELQALPQGPLFGVTDHAAFKALTDGAGLGEFDLRRHEIAWRMKTVDPLLAGLCEWGNIGALPRHIQERIDQTTRSNALAYQQQGGFVFPHSVLVGAAARAS